MTADKTQGEGNRLIMFFDGAEESEIEILGKLCPCIKWKEGYYPPDRLPEFHKDWSLLMPVVEKIEALQDNSIQFYIKDRRAYVERDTQASLADESLPDLPECYSGFCESKIDAVYSTIIQFIQWYNTNSK